MGPRKGDSEGSSCAKVVAEHTIANAAKTTRNLELHINPALI
jgi:hypothetical protein